MDRLLPEMKGLVEMKYRTLGKTKVSALGFGAMRLPTKGNESDVDEAKAIEMIRYAIDQGVNYIDTAYVYHGGNSEGVVGKALADGYRDKVHLATKLPIWNVQKVEDCDRILHEQLSRFQMDHVDFYLLHCLQRKSWQKMRELGVLQWSRKPSPMAGLDTSVFLPRHLRGFRRNRRRLRLVVLPDPIQLRQ